MLLNNKTFLYQKSKDVIQFRPRRATKIPSTSSQSKKSKGSKKSSTLSQRLFVGTESRKISDTLTSCLKKNESFIDAGTLDAIPIQECNSTNRNTLATTHIEVHKKGILIIKLRSFQKYKIYQVE